MASTNLACMMRGLATLLVVSVTTFAQAQPDAEGRSGIVLPLGQDDGLRGVAEMWAENAIPHFPEVVTDAGNRPNIVVVMLDDVGFGQTATFGGSIPTATLDNLAERGLRYNNFHTTGICSPTRAALLTGRNHHNVGTGTVTNAAYGYPGYNMLWGDDAASIATVLRHHGYNTAMFGKWHNTPMWEEGASGPFNRWPTGKGFDYFYGFVGGDTNQFHPALYENTVAINPELADDYHFTTDMVDKTIGWIKTQRASTPQRPFFVYVAPGAAHAPLQVKREWIDRFKGKFDHGYDRERERVLARQKQLGVVPPDTRLASRPPQLPAWDELSADERKVSARLMEVFAGFLAHTDHEVGRIVTTLDELGVRENTLFIYIVGDNGSSAEGGGHGLSNEITMMNGETEPLASLLERYDELGGANTHAHFPAAWAWAGSAPFNYFKRYVSHLGAVRNPLVISWPRGIAKQQMGGLRSQFHHVIDVVPTILDAVKVPAPRVVNGVEQMPMDGVSMLYTLTGNPPRSQHETQYFSIGDGRMAIYHEGWLASFSGGGKMPWQFFERVASPRAAGKWQLFNLMTDFSQSEDVASRFPDKLAEMVALFHQQAEKNNVYPVDVSESSIFSGPSPRAGRSSFVYSPGMTRVREGIAPRTIGGAAHTITVTLKREQGDNGVLVAQGGRFNGYALSIQDGHLVYDYNYLALERTRIRSTTPVPTGDVRVKFVFTPDDTTLGAGGRGQLYSNDQLVAEEHIPRTIKAFLSLDEGLDVGMDLQTAVGENYPVPFAFAGVIGKVVVELN